MLGYQDDFSSKHLKKPVRNANINKLVGPVERTFEKGAQALVACNCRYKDSLVCKLNFQNLDQKDSLHPPAE